MAKLILSFSELAGMYFPGCSTPKNAVRSLQRSIKRCTNLATALVETAISLIIIAGSLPSNTG